jgi:hypothetical protein
MGGILVLARKRAVTIMRTAVEITQNGLADTHRSSYEPFLFYLSFVLMVVWGIAVVIPIFFVAALADGFDWAWRYLRQPTRELLRDEIPPLNQVDSQ